MNGETMIIYSMDFRIVFFFYVMPDVKLWYVELWWNSLFYWGIKSN